MVALYGVCDVGRCVINHCLILYMYGILSVLRDWILCAHPFILDIVFHAFLSLMSAVFLRAWIEFKVMG